MSEVRILVFEPDEDGNRAVTTGLIGCEFVVVSVLDPERAGQALEGGGLDFALVCCDDRQPDDERVLRRVAEAKLPFAVLASRPNPRFTGRAIEMGAMGYFLKPLDVSVIAPSIRLWIARARELRQSEEERSSLLTALQNGRSTGTAVGMLMERHQLSADRAFECLRRQARSERVSVTQLASRIVAGASVLNLSTVLERRAVDASEPG